ncbi:glycosyl hydrolase family 18 protein [Alicyclobacillus pomorum]|uniref:glycosyl hydrolase family 18 protein n=1 Tax=Alicyclobacillus pomorum TaxID=204470 RepID=UPI00040EF34D|nr:glycosyl hydrolase family 18 protein [Alicyclobacillus pomorum]
MHPHTPSALLRWFAAVVGMIVIAAGCLGSLLLLYGGGSWQSAAQMEATSLASLEISELVGTPNYQKSDDGERHSLLEAVSTALKLPLANPQGMLAAQLPITDPAVGTNSGMQGSLFQSLSTWEQSSKKLALGWMPYDTPSRTIHMIHDNPGISVVSPKWLSVASQDGTLTDHTQASVVDYAHAHKIKVWAMFDNQFSAGLTHAVLSQPGQRERLVQSVANAANQGHLDGVNVDFENIRSGDQQNFTAFIKALSQALHPMGVQLSVDITPDIVYLKDEAAYFHAGLAQYCDYVILMAYDEHWENDPTPGPVADVPWVTESVDDLLSTGVPADKLILGIPFYARFWYVHKDGSVNSESIAAPDVNKVLTDHNVKGQWDDNLGLMYVKYPKPDGYEVGWYETDRTMQRKLDLVNNLGLPGVAIWSLSLSSTETWNSMIQSLRQSVS